MRCRPRRRLACRPRCEPAMPLCRACSDRPCPCSPPALLNLSRPHAPHLPTPLLQGFSEEQISCQRFLNLRYDGTDVPVMTLAPPGGDFAAAFEQAYQVGGAAGIWCSASSCVCTGSHTGGSCCMCHLISAPPSPPSLHMPLALFFHPRPLTLLTLSASLPCAAPAAGVWVQAGGARDTGG